jgi:hypothetical protein
MLFVEIVARLALIAEGKNSTCVRACSFPNVTGIRDPTGEFEKPHGQWNRLELVSQGGNIRLYVNGKLANEGTDAFPADGKILFQSEGAEVFFRNLMLYPLQ